MQTNQATPVASGTTTPAPKGKKGLGAAIFLAAIFLLIFKWLFFPSKKNGDSENDESKKTIKTEQKVYEPAVKIVKEIIIDSVYGEPFPISDGFNFSFFDASESWCLKNESEEEFCGKAGEDLSVNLKEKDPNNRTLWVKSSVGKKGTVKILLVSRY